MSPTRLSPNLFLNLNFDNTNSLDTNTNNLKFEWSTFNPNNSLTAVPSSVVDTPTSASDKSPTYEFLSVDNFNIDSFKNECILNLDQNLLNTVNDHHLLGHPNDKHTSLDLELQNFTLHHDSHKTGDLLDLGKPLNINVDELKPDKY